MASITVAIEEIGPWEVSVLVVAIEDVDYLILFFVAEHLWVDFWFVMMQETQTDTTDELHV